MCHRGGTVIGVARSVGDEESVVVEGTEVVVPRHAYQPHLLFEQLTDDVELHATVDQHYRFLTCSIFDHLPAAHLRHQVLLFGIVVFHLIIPVVDDLAQHGALLAQHLGEHAGVDAADAGDTLLAEPLPQALHTVPV